MSIPVRKSLCLIVLSVVLFSGVASAFDREQEGSRYRQWLTQLEQDLGVLIDQVPAEQPITRDDVERVCTKSLVPGFRATHNFAEFLAVRPSKGYDGKKLTYYGALQVVMHLLKASIPAGQGGLFPESPDSAFPDKALAVWYVHITDGSILQPYFDDKRAFKPYRLPANGVLERDVYPFLLFEDSPGGLRLGGFGREWWGAVQFLDSARFY